MKKNQLTLSYREIRLYFTLLRNPRGMLSLAMDEFTCSTFVNHVSLARSWFLWLPSEAYFSVLSYRRKKCSVCEATPGSLLFQQHPMPSHVLRSCAKTLIKQSGRRRWMSICIAIAPLTMGRISHSWHRLVLESALQEKPRSVALVWSWQWMDC